MKFLRYVGGGLIGLGMGISISWLWYSDYGIFSILPAALILIGWILYVLNVSSSQKVSK